MRRIRHNSFDGVRRLTFAVLSIVSACGMEDALDKCITERYARADFQLDPQPEGFSCKQIEAAVASFVSTYQDKKLYLLRFSAPDQVCSNGVFSTHVGYEVLLYLRKRSESSTRNCAEAVVTPIGSNIRIRRPSGQILQCVSGKNPLIVSVDNIEISLVWLKYNPTKLSEDERLSVFGLAKELSVNQAKKAYLEVISRFPAESVDFLVRPIPWFPSTTLFPLNHDYIEPFNPPTEFESSRIPTITCDSRLYTPGCKSFAFPKGIGQ